MVKVNPKRCLTCMITGSGRLDRVVRDAERALDAGVDLVQLRRKETPVTELEWIATALLERRPESRERILVNERLDLAVASGAGGVHLPADGLPAREVRRALGGEFRIGVSAHRLAEAKSSARDGANFIIYGPVFPTKSKPGHPGVGLARLAEVCSAVAIPVYAVGGVNPRRVPDVIAAGASGVAGISVFERESSMLELLENR